MCDQTYESLSQIINNNWDLFDEISFRYPDEIESLQDILNHIDDLNMLLSVLDY